MCLYPETKSKPHLIRDAQYKVDKPDDENEPHQFDEITSNLIGDCLCISGEDLRVECQPSNMKDRELKGRNIPVPISFLPGNKRGEIEPSPRVFLEAPC